MMVTMILSSMNSIIFTMMKHPLSMGLILIIQTIIIAIYTGMMINMFWFSYILIITMLSGTLVLFIYMASVASNEKFSSSLSMSCLILPMITLCLMIPFLVDQLKYEKDWSTSKKNMIDNDQLMTLIKLFNMNNMSITIMLVSYLFLTMIAISFIVNIYEGPLRMKN
uniref:NADH-ubiquinone oxidoreductase chain 6 n=1 Tax=Canthesancus helluo TaxID=2126071 RepID=A0A343W940_9HEMI|nr:NADH dehydrogenase subunit 6 [Canthesancus helluo]AVZ00880.1 NADH dehydrogenase subunit 6 [Canthesancus helluo]